METRARDAKELIDEHFTGEMYLHKYFINGKVVVGRVQTRGQLSGCLQFQRSFWNYENMFVYEGERQ